MKIKTEQASLSAYQMELISHSLGIDIYYSLHSRRQSDKILPDKFYRNYFSSGESGDARKTLDELEKMEVVKSFLKFGNTIFVVTEFGIEWFRNQFKREVTDKFVMPSRSVVQYQDFLHADCGLTFAEYNGIKLPKFEYNSQYLVRMVSTKYEDVKGDWCELKRDAKSSYKIALKNRPSK